MLHDPTGPIPSPKRQVSTGRLRRKELGLCLELCRRQELSGAPFTRALPRLGEMELGPKLPVSSALQGEMPRGPLDQYHFTWAHGTHQHPMPQSFIRIFGCLCCRTLLSLPTPPSHAAEQQKPPAPAPPPPAKHIPTAPAPVTLQTSWMNPGAPLRRGELHQPSLEGAQEHPPHQLTGLQHPPCSHRCMVTYAPALGLTRHLAQFLSTGKNSKRACESKNAGNGF